MTYLDLVEAVSVHTMLTKKAARELLDTVASLIIQAVERDHRFSWPQLGVFHRRTRRARTIRNPQTGALMRLPATQSLGFRAAKATRSTS